MKGKRIPTVTLVLGLLLALAAGLGLAQGPEVQNETSPQAEVSLSAVVGSKISYQGVLKENGNPVTGNRDMVFRFYDNSSCSGSPLQSVTKHNVPVDNGLFSVDLSVSQSHFNGQGVWLRVQVEGTNLGCEEILPVPYALSLRPGAVINHTTTSAVLNVFNQGNGWGLDAYSKGHDAVHGRSDASNHAGVSGTNSGGGIGVYGYSGSGTGVYGSSGTSVAIRAAGTGIIQSSAKSYVWISGNNLRKKHSTDSTQFELDRYGGVKVRRGTDGGTTRDVMLPVILPGQLYGQNVTLTGIDVYFKSQSDFDGIGGTFVRRQTEAGSGVTIISDGTDRSCPAGTSCSYHLNLTQNNELSDEQGVVYIAFQLFFAGADTYVQIGGVRLTLEHE